MLQVTYDRNTIFTLFTGPATSLTFQSEVRKQIMKKEKTKDQGNVNKTTAVG
jgi:hypothetical protein